MAKILDQLWAKIFAGLILGVIVGYILGPDVAPFSPETTAEISAWLALPGNLFLTFIRFIIIPIVISSVMLGIAGRNDIAKGRKIG
ncbi:MAG: cation:dicarboxylase symporter family transporter, partial [Proteobacteria bacterium]|nr:cation:dicarboxylase symporter family transporter [Pseudomonadota bacterium]